MHRVLVFACLSLFGLALPGQTVNLVPTPASPIQTPVNSPGSTQGVAVGDFNHDGKPDVALLTDGSPTYNQAVVILLGNGDGTFQPGVQYPTGRTSQMVLTGAFRNPKVVPAAAYPNGDRILDLVVPNFADGDISILLGNGDGTFQNAQKLALTRPATGLGPNPYYVAAGDFNDDGNLDLAVTLANSTKLAIFLGNGDGTFQPQSTINLIVQEEPGWIGAAPFTRRISQTKNAPIVDLVIVVSGSLLLLRANVNASGDPDGTFQAPQSFPTGVAGSSSTFAPRVWCAIADLNGDGSWDVAIPDPSATTGGVSVLLGNRDGTFQAPRPNVLGAAATAATIADFDGDGKPDLAVGDQAAEPKNLAVLPGKGDGTFRTAVYFDAGPSPQVVATGDFDNNLKPDIAVANQIFPSGSSVAAGTILMNGATVGPLPTLVQGGVKSVANGAGLSPPGSLIYAQGTNLASATLMPLIATSTPLPTHLKDDFDDVSATVDGVQAPMYYALPNYVAFQLPWKTDLSTGNATLVVTRNGVVSAPLRFPVGKFSPGIYTTSGNGIGMAWAIFAAPSKINPKGQVAQAGNVGPYLGVAATAGDVLYIYAGGLGPPKNALKMVDGQAPCPLQNNVPGACPAGYKPSDYATSTTPVVDVGGVQAAGVTSILDPTYPGLYLVYFTVPATAPKGNAVPVRVQIPGIASTDPTKVTIAIQ